MRTLRPHSVTDNLHHPQRSEHAKVAVTVAYDGLGDSLEARIQPPRHAAESEVWSGGQSKVGWAPGACADDLQDYQLQE
jgi:hypothetical protein